jgi:hypothetical protein
MASVYYLSNRTSKHSGQNHKETAKYVPQNQIAERMGAVRTAHEMDGTVNTSFGVKPASSPM